MSDEEEPEVRGSDNRLAPGRAALRARLAGMNQNEKIDFLLKKSHFRSDKKVVAYVNGTLTDLGLPIILAKKILHRNKWNRAKNNYRWFPTRHYEYPIFANHFNSFQMDIIEQDQDYRPEDGAHRRPDFIPTEPPDKRDDPPDEERKNKPPYIYVFQNVNTKYVRAVAMWDKTEASILRALKLLWWDTDHRVVSLVSDKEPSLGGASIVAWLAKHKISLKTIRGDRHTALGVINRLIRTLRDMNTPERFVKGTPQLPAGARTPVGPLGPKSKHQSTHRKYQDFTIYRIAKLIHAYNHTKHDTTHRTPIDVDHDPEWEEGWIIRKLYETEERKRLSDYELEVGDMVRYILPKQNETGPMVKRRYSLTPESYKITAQDGYAYVIAAQNKTTLTVPRWRLKLCSAHEESLHPWALEFPAFLKPKRRPHREDAHPENIYAGQPAPPAGRSPDQVRDKFMREWFDKLHMEGDALISPSEGREVAAGGRPGMIGSRHFRDGDHRLFIPILTAGHGHELWVLIVVQFKDGVAKPRFYSPETNPQDGIPGRWPTWKTDLGDYIRSLGPHRVQLDEDHLFIHGLARPGPRDPKARSFFYIADYAARFLFRGSEPPRENDAERPPITIPKEILKDLKRLLPTGQARLPRPPSRVARLLTPEERATRRSSGGT
jgi:hypothetical protein